jgi:hypothetical protein
MQGVFRILWMTAYTAPLLVGAGLIFIPLIILAAVPGYREHLPPPRAFLLVLGAPLVVVLWSGLNYAAESALAADAIHWRSFVHIGLSFASAVVAVGVPFHFRRSPKAWLLIPCGVVALLYTVLVWFIGTMAIVDDWI